MTPLGYKHTKEARLKMSRLRTGFKVSDKTKKKIAKSHKGLKQTLSTRVKIGLAVKNAALKRRNS